MIAYYYDRCYIIDRSCCIFASKKGVKLSFFNGAALPDAENILKGTAKTTRYLQIKNEADIHSPALKQLRQVALQMYHQRGKGRH